MKWQKCPVCNGVGTVSGSYFTRAGDGNGWSSTNATEICRICQGAGIILEAPDLPNKDRKKKGC